MGKKTQTFETTKLKRKKKKEKRKLLGLSHWAAAMGIMACTH
jgi:hypothetical protein